jgi:hypothetical protein
VTGLALAARAFPAEFRRDELLICPATLVLRGENSARKSQDGQTSHRGGSLLCIVESGVIVSTEVAPKPSRYSTPPPLAAHLPRLIRQSADARTAHSRKLYSCCSQGPPPSCSPVLHDCVICPTSGSLPRARVISPLTFAACFPACLFWSLDYHSCTLCSRSLS